jgi:phospholipid-translocating ATPase
VKSKDLRVGDIVKLEGGDRVPADMITLYSDNDQGTLFLKTDQLDGETDWKLRKAVKMTQSVVKQPEDYFSLYNSSFLAEIKYIEC